MAKSKSVLAPKPKAIDPSLDALFSQSAGAVKTPPKSRYTELLPQRSREAPEEENDDDAEEEEDGSEDEEAQGSEEELEGDESEAEDAESEAEEASDASSAADEPEATEVLETAVSQETAQDEGRKRKRKQRDDDEDLETNYLERLVNDEAPTGKRRKAGEEGADGAAKEDGAKEKDSKEGDDSSDDELPVHESLKKTDNAAATELEKANRTVFLSNVAVDAITSGKSKKILLNHLNSVLDKKADPPQKVESIRFRSTAFATAAIPKRAAFIKKEVLDATTKSTNAYAVYTTTAAARLAVAQLNGTMVLDRHIRVDSVAHPAPVDHRRCVFVGNLGFVDDETVYNTTLNSEGKEVTEKRKRTKTPMDVEEGLWRVFSKEGGKVESVRVVRDAATRVGKGFAYVQFYDGNAVESAILLNGKKFPPMLPRELRVTRCKAPHKTARAMEARQARAPASSDRKGGDKKARKGDTGKYVPKPTAESQTLAGRATKLLGRFGAAKLAGKPQGRDRRERNRKWLSQQAEGAKGGEKTGTGPAAAAGEKTFKAPEEFVFEGRRASAKDGKPKDLKFKGTKSKGGKKWRGKR